jgi:hypothetical protein
MAGLALIVAAGSAGEASAQAPGAPSATASTGSGQINLAALEQRLRDTPAIGVMTKLTLKNQVDELVERFRAHHAGRDATPLAQLRQPYDLLILKVLSLIQDKDPSLAGSIAASREAIWTMLTDRGQFSNL